MHGNLHAAWRCQQILRYVRMTKHKDWVFILLIIAVLCITSLVWWKWAEWVRLIKKAQTSKYNPCTKLSSDITPDLFHSIHCSIRYSLAVSEKKGQKLQLLFYFRDESRKKVSRKWDSMKETWSDLSN